MFTLFESLCKVCISMFGPWIGKKVNEIKKSHAHQNMLTMRLSDYGAVRL